jgi:hypothetical protein
LGVDHSTANRWLFLLASEAEGVLRLDSKGSQQSRRASRYRYLSDGNV